MVSVGENVDFAMCLNIFRRTLIALLALTVVC